MAHNVNPTSLRLGIQQFWNTKDFQKRLNYLEDKSLVDILSYKLLALKSIIYYIDLKDYPDKKLLTIFLYTRRSPLIKRQKSLYLYPLKKDTYRRVKKKNVFFSKLPSIFSSKANFKVSSKKHTGNKKFSRLLPNQRAILANQLYYSANNLTLKIESLELERLLSLYYSKRVMVCFKNIMLENTDLYFGNYHTTIKSDFDHIVQSTLEILSFDNRYDRYSKDYLIDLVSTLNLAILSQSPSLLSTCVSKFVFQNRRHMFNILSIQNIIDIIVSFYHHTTVTDVRLQVTGKIHNRRRAKAFNTRYFWYYPINSISTCIKYHQTYVTVKSGSLSIKVWFLFSNKKYNIRKS